MARILGEVKILKYGVELGGGLAGAQAAGLREKWEAVSGYGVLRFAASKLLGSRSFIDRINEGSLQWRGGKCWEGWSEGDLVSWQPSDQWNECLVFARYAAWEEPDSGAPGISHLGRGRARARDREDAAWEGKP